MHLPINAKFIMPLVPTILPRASIFFFFFRLSHALHLVLLSFINSSRKCRRPLPRATHALLLLLWEYCDLMPRLKRT